MICPKCGSECKDNQLFCTKCGTKVNTFIKPAPQSENPAGLKEPFEYIVSGVTEHDDSEDINSYQRGNAGSKPHGTAQINYTYEHIIDDDFKDEFEEELYPKKRNYKSTGKADRSIERSSKNSSAKNNRKSSNNTAGKKGNGAKYNSSVNVKKQKGSNAKKVIIIILAAIISVTLAVVITLQVKKSTMTKKFDEYYGKATQYYDTENYKDAKTQFINAANNAFTSEQKIKSYEMIYKVDEIIGGYDEEEMKYLEMLIDIDDSNVEYYKALIILYQNNDLNNKIDILTSSAPAAVREKLQGFDGSIPKPDIPEGTYDKPLEIELSSTDNTKIYYTTDGSDITESNSGSKYKSPIKLTEEGVYTIKAVSIDKNGKKSQMMTAKYIIDFGKINPPVVNLSSGKYTEEAKIQVTADEGCKIYYTTDGTTPTKNSKRYKKAIKLPRGNSLYYFVAVNEDGVSSVVVTRAYEYTPEYKYDYNSAINSLTSKFVSIGKFENQYGEFANGDVAYFKYNEVSEIDNEFYYIVSCQIENKNGAVKSSRTYAVSTNTGMCYSASAEGDSYSIKELK